MKNHSLHIGGTPGLRVDGIDVAQLLRDLGEASPASSAVDLFGLCLKSQRVLASVHDVAPGGLSVETSLDETELLGSYRALNDDGRSRVASLARRFRKHFARRRPALVLVPANQREHGGAR